MRTDNDVRHFVGGTLGQLRRRRGLTRAELGETIGVSDRRIQQYETGECRPPANHLLRIGAALGVEIGALFREPRP